MYAHETYFRHLRLYDFVLKNTKLSEVKRVHLPIEEPNSGKDLTTALTLADENTNIRQLEDALKKAKDSSGSQHGMHGAGNSGAQGSHSDPLGSNIDIIGSKDNMVLATGQDGESATDSDMDEIVRSSVMERASKNTLHRANKGWNNKITAAVTREVKTPMPAS